MGRPGGEVGWGATNWPPPAEKKSICRKCDTHHSNIVAQGEAFVIVQSISLCSFMDEADVQDAEDSAAVSINVSMWKVCF